MTSAANRPRDADRAPTVRFRKTTELVTSELYQRRKRNLLFFCSVIILITLTQPKERIPVPLLGGEVKLPVELAFLACILATIYFAWEFYIDWETTRRVNAESVQFQAEVGNELGSELERLILVGSEQFALSTSNMRSALNSIVRLPENRETPIPDVNRAIEKASSSLTHIAKELPNWRQSAQDLRESYSQLHDTVSRLQRMNFFIDLVVATALTCAAIGAAGYIILNSFLKV
jgi:hypothetical protein